jgi:predicted DNA-binding transcriptional regulator YafY
MSRATDAEKAERLNAAHRLVARGLSVPDAVQTLIREFDLSRRQAYRYVQEAQAIGHPVPRVEPSIPVTFKIPANVIRDLRAYAASSGLTLGEIVARAITAFLAAVRRHG